MSAKIWAPPLLFFVDTPSGVAADLGCAYTLEVDDLGASLLRVTSGWVALRLIDIESVVPAGAACATRPGVGPGIPYFEDSTENFKSALSRLDFDRELTEDLRAPVLNLVIAEARPRDTLTLWHLLYRVQGPQREQVFERMAALAPPPEDVTRAGCLQLDEKMLHLWKGYLDNSWSQDSGLKKAWVDMWTRGPGKIKRLEGNGKTVSSRQSAISRRRYVRITVQSNPAKGFVKAHGSFCLGFAGRSYNSWLVGL